MKISKKCQYALKAVFELAWRGDVQPVRTRDIANAQQMSPRFTEIILNELRHGDLVESRRGNDGGYFLARSAADLTVREVVECIEGPISVAENTKAGKRDIDFFGNNALKKLWCELNTALCEVCEQKTFADMVEFERASRGQCVPDYCI